MKKIDIRKVKRKARQSQSLALKNKKDKRIFEQLFELPFFVKSKEVFTYLSFDNEPNTDIVINKFVHNRRILVPVMGKDEIFAVELPENAKFKKGKFGIREPINYKKNNKLKKIEIALIPGIAFDESGNRIGFGGGYFDKFLKKVHCTTIALAYEFQIIDKVPADEYDIAVDWIVTEKRVIKCAKSQI